MLKLQIEQNDLSSMTFQPKISNFARERGTSELQLSSNPSKFLEKYAQNQQEKQLLREKYEEEKKNLEIKECTFAPKTSECPEYVKRIAKSMAIVKAARNSSNNDNSVKDDAVKPEWR
jgi:hypothetical protein